MQYKNNLNDLEGLKVTLVDTGLETNTGGRINNIKSEIEKGDSFMLTYGDGLSNVDISKLIKFHKKKLFKVKDYI